MRRAIGIIAIAGAIIVATSWPVTRFANPVGLLVAGLALAEGCGLAVYAYTSHRRQRRLKRLALVLGTAGCAGLAAVAIDGAQVARAQALQCRAIQAAIVTNRVEPMVPGVFVALGCRFQR